MFKINIHKRKIYLNPKPKEDIEGGLIIELNKPKEGTDINFISTDIEANKKEYKLPSLPAGYWVKGVYVKEENKKGKI